MNKRIAVLLVALLFVVHSNGKNVSQWAVFSKYLEKAEEVNSFDDFSIHAERIDTVEYRDSLVFTKNNKNVLLNQEDTIPIAVFNDFLKKHAFVGKLRPALMENHCGSYVGRQLRDVGYVFGSPNDKCIEKIFPIAKRTIAAGVHEFMLCQRDKYGIYITLFFYNELTNSVASYITLYSSGISGLVCDLDYRQVNDINIQTTKIENGLITQLVNDGMELWTRKIYFSKEAGGYLELWSGQSDVNDNAPLVYKVVIQNSDGDTNVRKKPDASSDILYQVSQGKVFVISEDECSGWHRVLLYKDEYDGWIHKSKIKILSKDVEF